MQVTVSHLLRPWIDILHSDDLVIRLDLDSEVFGVIIVTRLADAQAIFLESIK